MQVFGTVEKSSLEGGKNWMLKADNGTVYQLEGLTYEFTSGEALYFEGEVDKSSCSLGMQGPVLKFTEYTDMAPVAVTSS